MTSEPREGRIERLRNSMDVWVAGLDPILEEQAMIEVAFLMAAADGEISPPEYERLVETITTATASYVPPGRARAMLRQLSDALRIDGWRGRIAAIAAKLPSPQARRAAYRLAAGVSFVDGWVQDAEASLFGLLAEAFEIPLEEASEILMDVRDEIYGREELTNPVILLQPSRRRADGDAGNEGD